MALTTLWSVQHDAVIARLGTARLTATYDFVPRDRLPATRWMTDQMRARGLALDPENAPIWTFLEKPEPRTSGVWGSPPPGADMHLLRLSVPRSRVLVSYHFPWAYHFLHVASPDAEYLFSSDAERAERGFRKPPEEDCRQSWQKLFDLTLMENPDTTWWHPSSAGDPPPHETLFRLQATAPFLLPEDLAEIVPDW